MPEIGQKIGPFQLSRWIASDRDSSLYYAIRPDSLHSPKEVAIRITNSLKDTQAKHLIEMEYKILGSIKDKCIPRALAHYAGQGAIAMRWIRGVTLRSVLDAHANGLISLDPITSMEIVTELANSLRHIHAIRLGNRELIHGRIRPENIMLNRDGEIFLIGLGRPPYGNHPSYSPPEQAARAFLDWRADQWALGAIGIELLLQEPLYKGRRDLQHAAEQGEVQHWLRRLEYDWPQIAIVFTKILHPAAGARFQSQTELLRALMEISRSLDGYSQRRIIAEVLCDHHEAQEYRKSSSQTVPNHDKLAGQQEGAAIPQPISQNHNNKHPSQDYSTIELEEADPGTDLITEAIPPQTEVYIKRLSSDPRYKTVQQVSFFMLILYAILVVFFLIQALIGI